MPPQGRFLDYDIWWNIVVGWKHLPEETARYKNMLLHDKRKNEDWLKQATEDPHSVMLVVPELDLRAADLICVKSQEAMRIMRSRGFNRINIYSGNYEAPHNYTD